MVDLTEILKDCPKGIKLYSPIFGDVYLDKIRPYLAVVVTTNKEQNGFKEEFLYDGRYGISGECMLFPSKEQRDWSKWHRPFKDGDIVISDKGDIHLLRTSDSSYCAYRKSWRSLPKFDSTITTAVKVDRFATEEEKQKLFDAIKANGYKWNDTTKTLEKVIEPKFKVGDIIKDKCNLKWKVIDVNSHYYEVSLVLTNTSKLLEIKAQDDYELVPKKFDVSKLQPFDKVLVRDDNTSVWVNAFFGFYDIVMTKKYPVVASGINWAQCIPYEGNEHLLGTFNQPSEFYRYWEE